MSDKEVARGAGRVLKRERLHAAGRRTPVVPEHDHQRAVERPPIGPFDEFEPPVHRVPEPRLLDARRHGATEGQRTHEGRNRGSFSLSRHKNAMRGVDAASDNPWPTPWYGL